VIDPADLIERFGPHAVRYFLLAEFSPFIDGDFSEERLIARYNADLANGLGNLLSRATSMTVRYRDGVIPAAAEIGDPERALAEQLTASEQASVAAMAGYDHREALARIWDLVRRTNAYVDERAPWHLAKDPAQASTLDTTLHYLVAAVRQLGRLLQPFLPQASDTIVRAVGAEPDKVPHAQNWLDNLAGVQISKSPALFPRIDVPTAQ
jgi:methionyl-tRNA synthetase